MDMKTSVSPSNLKNRANATVVNTQCSFKTLSEKDSFERLSTEPLTKMSSKEMLFHIFKNGMAGSLAKINMLLMTEFIFLTRLNNSNIYIAGKENTTALCNFFMQAVVGFNCGQVLCISRCKGVNDYEGIRHFMKMHFWFMRWFIGLAILISGIVEIVVQWIYYNEVLKWTRIMIVFNLPYLIMMF